MFLHSIAFYAACMVFVSMCWYLLIFVGMLESHRAVRSRTSSSLAGAVSAQEQTAGLSTTKMPLPLNRIVFGGIGGIDKIDNYCKY